MKRIFLLALLGMCVLLAGCNLLPLSTPPAVVPTFYLGTSLPTSTVTPTPTATVTPTPTATAGPVVPGDAGQIYVSLVERPPDAKFTLRLVRLPAGCVDCPTPVDVPGYMNATGEPDPLAWSPDGKTAALRVPAAGESPASVQLYNPEDNTWKSAAEFDDLLTGPYWSPDGQMLAVYATQDGKTDFYTISADGSQVKNISKGVLGGYQQVLPAGWLNSELVFSALTNKGIKAHAINTQYPRVHILSNIIVLSGEADQPLPLLPSPDNKWIAYTEITPRVGQTLGLLRVKDTEVSHTLVSSKDGRVVGYTWSPDGAWLAFWLKTGQTTDLEMVRPDGSELHPVYTTQEGIRSTSFDPGGGEWMLVETAGQISRLVLVNAVSGETRAVNAPVGEVSWEGASWRPVSK